MQLRERLLTFAALVTVIAVIMGCIVGGQWFTTLPRELQVLTVYGVPALLVGLVVVVFLVVGVFWVLRVGVQIGAQAGINNLRSLSVHHHTPSLPPTDAQPGQWVQQPPRAFDMVQAVGDKVRDVSEL